MHGAFGGTINTGLREMGMRQGVEALQAIADEEAKRLAKLRADPVHSKADFMPASFPLGRVWCVAVLSPDRMQWTRRWRFAGLRGPVPIECFNAERDVIEAGFETFAPMETRVKIRRGRKTITRSPLFGSYIFVRIDREADNWPALIDCGDVDDILRVMGIPVRIPDELVDLFQRAEQAGAHDYSAEKSPFSAGEEVEIAEGPFAGTIAKIKSARPRQRVKLLLQALGTIDVDPCFLRKL